MGQKHSIEDDLINFRITSKQLLRSSRKCEKNMATQKEKCKQAIVKGDLETARIHGENVIREKNQAANYLRLSSRIDAVASRLETSIRMQQISTSMGDTVKSMSNAMKTMNVESISKLMTDFENKFNDMEIRSKCLENSLEYSTTTATPPEEVDTLIQMIADETGLKISEAMSNAGTVPTKQQVVEEKSADDLEARLAALRR